MPLTGPGSIPWAVFHREGFKKALADENAHIRPACGGRCVVLRGGSLSKTVEELVRDLADLDEARIDMPATLLANRHGDQLGVMGEEGGRGIRLVDTQTGGAPRDEAAASAPTPARRDYCKLIVFKEIADAEALIAVLGKRPTISAHLLMQWTWRSAGDAREAVKNR